METGSISKAMKPFLTLSMCTGVYPILRKEVLPILLFIYSLVIVAVLGYAGFGVILWLQDVDTFLYDSLMHLAIEKAQKGFLYFNFITIFASALYYHKPFNRVLTEFNKLEKSLKLIGMSVTYNMRSIIFTGLIKFATLVGLLILDYFLSSDTHWLLTAVDLIATHGPLIPIFASQLQFYAALSYIGQQLNYSKEKLQVVLTHVAFENRFLKVYGLIRIYDDLRSMSLELSKISSISNLITVASIFFLGIVEIHLFSIAGTFKREQLLTFLSGSILLRMYELWTILHPFVIISNEVDSFNRVLFRFMIQDRKGDYSNDDKLYIHVALKKGIRFTAWEFFTLDYSLILAVVGAATTLLVLLIQYSLSKRELWCEDT